MSRLSGLKSAFTTAKWVLFAAILYFFVLPLIPGFRKAVSDLTQIKPSLLVLGLGLEFAALFSYSLLTKAALAEHGNEISVLRLFRIQLSTKAVGNVLPGGSAASTALGYRMLTLSGVAGPDAGFALATAGLGSAVMLNVILWFGLIVSAGRGVNAAYGTAAIIGIILMLIAAALIFGLIDGQGRAERFIRLCARKLRMDEDHAAEVLEHLGNRLQGLASEPKLLTRVLVWALVNWLLDMLALYVFIRAFGGDVAPDALIVVRTRQHFVGRANYSWRTWHCGGYLHSNSCWFWSHSKRCNCWRVVVSNCTVLATDSCWWIHLPVTTCWSVRH